MLPSGPESEEGDPKGTIEWRDLGFRFLLAVCRELLAKIQLGLFDVPIQFSQRKREIESFLDQQVLNHRRK